MMHIAHDVAYPIMGLTCFATERKHRTAARAALYVLRIPERTVVMDLVDKQCSSIANGMNLYETFFGHAGHCAGI